MSRRLSSVLQAIDRALEGAVGGPPQSELDLSDPGQRPAGRMESPAVGEGCWRCQSAGQLEGSGLCRPCRLYLAEVTDTDPRDPYDPVALREQIAAANLAIEADRLERRAASLLAR